MLLRSQYPVLRHAGFSLVELSIVLVILGLLIGGILSGQALIRAAELRKITTNISKYVSLHHTFRTKYLSLPGDIPNATMFWGAANTAGANGNCASPLTNTGSGTATCNGNGDGSISGYENYRYWQHMVNAQLIEGTYTGIAGSNPGPGGYDDVPGVNHPTIPSFPDSVYVIGFLPQITLDTYYGFNVSEANFLRMARCCHPTNRLADAPFISPQEGYNIDAKIDDGRPYTGKLQTMKGYWSACTTANAVTADYTVANTARYCSLYYPI